MANVRTDRIYQDFEPATRWTSEPGAEILVADLPGFRKDQVRVAVTPTRNIRLTGERPAGGNRWIRFRREIPLPSNVDADSISAMFKDSKLYVRHPKTKLDIPQTKPPTPAKPPVVRPHSQSETKQGHVSKPAVNERKPEIEQPNGSKTNQLNPDVEQKSKELSDAKGESSETKTPSSSKDEEKDKVGAKRLEKYKEATRNLVKEAKNKRQTLYNLVGVLLLVLLILLYARNAAKSALMGKPEE